jgi:hypothetical protein
MVILLQQRPDLKIFVIPAAPIGLGVVTNLNSDSTVLRERYDQVAAE